MCAIAASGATARHDNQVIGIHVGTILVYMGMTSGQITQSAFIYTHLHTLHQVITARNKTQQEAQLPQRNSASATHMEGGLGPPAHSLDAPSGYIYMPLFEFETHNKRTAVH